SVKKRSLRSRARTSALVFSPLNKNPACNTFKKFTGRKLPLTKKVYKICGFSFRIKAWLLEDWGGSRKKNEGVKLRLMEGAVTLFTPPVDLRMLENQTIGFRLKHTKMYKK